MIWKNQVKLYYAKYLKDRAKELRDHPTFCEKIIWNSLKHGQLGYDFHRQKPLGKFIFDFFCYELKLVIEIDGASHDQTEVKENDMLKENYIHSLGFSILRFTDDEVIGNGNVVLSKIKEFIKKQRDSSL